MYKILTQVSNPESQIGVVYTSSLPNFNSVYVKKEGRTKFLMWCIKMYEIMVPLPDPKTHMGGWGHGPCFLRLVALVSSLGNGLR